MPDWFLIEYFVQNFSRRYVVEGGVGWTPLHVWHSMAIPFSPCRCNIRVIIICSAKNYSVKMNIQT